MTSKILIDLGSSTVKVYELESTKLNLIDHRSFHFKKNFDSKNHYLNPKDELDLKDYLVEIKNKFPKRTIKIYATGVFRQLSAEAEDQLSDYFDQHKISFKILSHDEESLYLELALVGRFDYPQPIMILNVGGATTEIIVMKNKRALERYNIEIGVGTILNQYLKVNQKISREEIKSIQDEIISKLPNTQTKINLIFFSGGELDYMKRAKYQLELNHLFSDLEHPYLITRDNLLADDQVIFYQKDLEELKKLYPENPDWSIGARAFEIIAESICLKFQIPYIIPSDCNLMHGVILNS